MCYNREELVYLAKTAEQTERFEEMIEYMKKVVEMDQELSEEERNLLHVAYKNTISCRRSALRIIDSIKEREG